MELPVLCESIYYNLLSSIIIRYDSKEHETLQMCI